MTVSFNFLTISLLLSSMTIIKLFNSFLHLLFSMRTFLQLHVCFRKSVGDEWRIYLFYSNQKSRSGDEIAE